MAIEVRIPTILRTYTGGRRRSNADGATRAPRSTRSTSDHPGIKERLIEKGDLRRFVKIYVNDEDVRFIGGLEAEPSDGDQVVVVPAVAAVVSISSTSGSDGRDDNFLASVGNTPLVGLPASRRLLRPGSGRSLMTATRPARSRIVR